MAEAPNWHGRPVITVCAWCPGAAERTKFAEEHGYSVSHTICPICSALLLKDDPDMLAILQKHSR